ncbi:hypothetical protein CEQ90_19940 [Lewinellaceae bacterium SD302]|nr:hypothetical protein CEQ90_19940 [Lewinellaceae bacterium SD302]
MTIIAKYIVILFGVFLIGVGVLLLLKPEKSREFLKKAGNTDLINYSVITTPMIPATGLIIYSEFSKLPELFKYFGWFMISAYVVNKI